ncbi:hypothetical protein BKD09_41995 [Bradyrhizobium japonicum]|uniref:Uncharacterized protein n=1 Tax=Bradyrhizobium japonicum TaxID=375 RepID=A0A1L3FNR3_BRAJP|nr:hypothetical protein BKD09_41995 [Bradyrhizobium japonicum]
MRALVELGAAVSSVLADLGEIKRVAIPHKLECAHNTLVIRFSTKPMTTIRRLRPSMESLY